MYSSILYSSMKSQPCRADHIGKHISPTIPPWLIRKSCTRRVPGSDITNSGLSPLTIAGCMMGPCAGAGWVQLNTGYSWVWPITFWDPSGAGISDNPAWFVYGICGTWGVWGSSPRKFWKFPLQIVQSRALPSKTLRPSWLHLGDRGKLGKP